MTAMIDAHHHLWDLKAVHYPWLMAQGVPRFFGDPRPIQRDYLLDEFRADATPLGMNGSVHIQVGADDPMQEARWVHATSAAHPDWPLAQVVFCDLRADDLPKRLDAYQVMSSVRGVRQIVGRAPEEDAETGTNDLLDDPRFLEGLRLVGQRGLSFDLQLIPELMGKTAELLVSVPETRIALCHAGSPHDRSSAGLKSWAKALEQLSVLPNVTCKLSGLGMFDHIWTTARIRGIVETCLEQFGPSRLMFGSNFPVDSLYSDYARIVEAFREILPEDTHGHVFQDTASEFYGLEA